MKFTELGLADDLMKAIKRAGFEEATPIQSETIPLALEGKDVIGQAQTGTGKTAAFGLPMLQKIDIKNPNIQALVVSPTRELAIQTQEELYRLGRDKKVKVQVVYGGADISRQIRSLKDKPQIIVGTPGRLLDHINRRTIRLDHVETLVLDEADEMLNMGFLEDIESIIKQVPDNRQTLLFSATMPPSIKRIGVQFMQEPHHIKIKSKELTTDLIDQYFVRSKDFEKFDVMTRLLDVQSPELTIVFGRTKRRVDELSKGLEARGYKAEGIHGDLSQQKRMSVLRAFKAGKLDILVATDVAARGLDISGVTHVYNYDIPQDPESYVHRIGRTGRAGREGVSVTFVTPNEMSYLRTIEELTKKPMTPLRPPTSQEAFEGQISSALTDVDEVINDLNMDKYAEMAATLSEKYSSVELAAAVLKFVTKDDSSEVPVKITPERPLPSRGKGGKSGGGSYKGGYKGKSSGNGGGSRGGYRGGKGGSGGDRRGRDNRGENRYDRKRNESGASDRRKNDGARKPSTKKNFTIRNKKD